jgi:hypothetical protein
MNKNALWNAFSAVLMIIGATVAFAQSVPAGLSALASYFPAQK